jgi:hypothetical protein
VALGGLSGGRKKEKGKSRQPEAGRRSQSRRKQHKLCDAAPRISQIFQNSHDSQRPTLRLGAAQPRRANLDKLPWLK